MPPKGIDLLPYRIGHQFGIIQFNMMTAVLAMTCLLLVDPLSSAASRSIV
jgi:hypothetical protein